MALKAIVGEKVAMSQVWVNDKVVPVTVLRVEPARIVQVKTTERDGYTALQVTYGHRDAKKLTKAEAGHFAKAGVDAGRRLVELRLDSVDGFEVGQEITVDTLAQGEKVDVTAVSRGKGYAGTMKRHNFGGQGASHGNHKHHRAPGSIGSCSFPGRVFKGLRMSGHMGHEQVTTLNLEVVQADTDVAPFSNPTGGSRITYSLGTAVFRAAVDARTVEVRLDLAEEGREALRRRTNMQVQVAIRP